MPVTAPCSLQTTGYLDREIIRKIALKTDSSADLRFPNQVPFPLQVRVRHPELYHLLDPVR